MPEPPFDFERELAKVGKKLVPLNKPSPKPTYVKLTSLAGWDYGDGTAVREAFDDDRHEYLVDRHNRHAGYDVCVLEEADGVQGIYGWAVETPKGEFARLKAEQADRPETGSGAVYVVERGE